MIIQGNDFQIRELLIALINNNSYYCCSVSFSAFTDCKARRAIGKAFRESVESGKNQNLSYQSKF